MNRIITFRGIGRNVKGFIFGNIQKYTEDGDYNYICLSDTSITDLSSALCCRVYENTITQYIGIYDKNKDPIYEGDVLLLSDKGNNKKWVSIVYSKGVIDICDLNQNLQKTLIDWLDDSIEFEVIDNIYDLKNHEYLRVKEIENAKPYKIKHKKTGLYYEPLSKYSSCFSADNNLSEKGKVYLTRSPFDKMDVEIILRTNSIIYKKFADVLCKYEMHCDYNYAKRYLINKSEFEQEFLEL